MFLTETVQVVAIFFKASWQPLAKAYYAFSRTVTCLLAER